MSELLFAAGTDIGYRSDNNEDSFCTDPELGLWLIADGMGGHEAGEIASAIVSETIVNAVREGVSLVDAIHRAHSAVISAGQNGEGAKGMGSTVVALQVKGAEFEVAWVGDSRAYLWGGAGEGELRQISRDHSYVQKLLDSGAITEEEALYHPNRNIITQSLGADLDDVVVDNITGQLAQQQKILLCSDGLSDEVQDGEIAAIFQEGGDEQTTIDSLIKAALIHGGKDNVTAVLVSAPNDVPDEFQTVAGVTQAVKVVSNTGNSRLWISVGLGVVCLIAIILFF